jgi:hypothetical protein
MEEIRYEVALQAALGLLHQLESSQAMPRQERLAKTTFAILDAIKLAQKRSSVTGRCLPQANPGMWALVCFD